MDVCLCVCVCVCVCKISEIVSLVALPIRVICVLAYVVCVSEMGHSLQEIVFRVTMILGGGGGALPTWACVGIIDDFDFDPNFWDWLFITYIDFVWPILTLYDLYWLFMTYIDFLLSPAAPKARDGRYCNAPRLSVRLSVRPSVTFSFRTVTQKRIDVFSRKFASTCTKSWGCAV